MYKLIISLFISSLLLVSCSEQVPETTNTPVQAVKNTNTIPPAPTEKTLRIGIVELSVENLSKMTDFYSDVVGFDIISTGGALVNLGENGQVFLRLIEETGWRFPLKNEAGLYHTAITHSSRKDLANRLSTILSIAPERYSGSADHSATEAFYFTDPEGNGLELYYDRPRTEWRYSADGKPIMGSAPLDTVAYIERYRDVPTSGGETRMGHIHLKIGDIEKAKRFYEDILLFEEMSDRGNALFVSRDGYHHHLGMNTWESLGAGVRNPKTYGLRSYELIYTKDIYKKIIANLKSANISYKEEGSYKVLDDPWGNTIKIRQQ